MNTWIELFVLVVPPLSSSGDEAGGSAAATGKGKKDLQTHEPDTIYMEDRNQIKMSKTRPSRGEVGVGGGVRRSEDGNCCKVAKQLPHVLAGRDEI